VRTPAMSGCRQADDPSPQNRRLPRRIRETYGRKPELFTRMCKGTAVAARYPPVGPQGADIRLKVGSRSYAVSRASVFNTMVKFRVDAAQRFKQIVHERSKGKLLQRQSAE